MIIDSHFHTNVYERYEGTIDRALTLLKENNIFVLSNSVDIDSFNSTVQLAEKSPFVLPCFGIHPQMAYEFVDKLDQLENFFDKAIIYGEIGLDHYYVTEKEQYPTQYKLLEYFFNKAQKQNKIVILHLDGAEEKGLELLRSYSLKRVIVHGYKGSLKTLQEFINEGYFISVGGNYLMEKFKTIIPKIDWVKYHSIVENIPDEYLMIESDGPCRTEPDPPPNALRSWPTYIFDIYNKIASIRDVKSEFLQENTSKNLLKLLKNDEKLSKYAHFISLKHK